MAEPKTKKPRQMPGLSELEKTKSPAQWQGFYWSILITRKIDMMGLIYGHFATQSSRIYKDFFPVKNLCCVYHCCLLQGFHPLVDT